MSFDAASYAIAPGEKASAFVLRVLRTEGALDADSAILRSALKPLVAPVTFVHLVKSGALIEAAIGDDPAFYAAAATDPVPAPVATSPAATTEAPMTDAATATETPAAVTREAIAIVKPAIPLTDVHPGLTLQSVVLRAIHEAPRAVSGREVVDIVGCARPSVFQSISIAFKDGLLTRTEGEDPYHYSTNPEKLAEVFEIINARGSAYPVWLRICESPADAETIAAATGISESGVRAAVKSLLRNGWAFENHKVGARKFYAGHATKQAAVEDGEDETGSEAVETGEVAAVATLVESAVLAPAVVEAAPVAAAPAPVAAAPASTDVLDLLLATPKGRAAVSSAFSALAQLAAALAS